LIVLFKKKTVKYLAKLKTLFNNTDMKRAYENLLREYLTQFPCVALIGPRQCGKTTLLEALDDSWRVFDLERGADFQAVTDDPDLFLSLHPGNIAIGEAQTHPALFPALRVAIDNDRQKVGRFIITGSSSPELTRSITESLAGRIGIIEMSPLSWSEVYPAEEPGLVDLLLDQANQVEDLVTKGTARADLKALTDYWFKGGYPEPWVRNDNRFRELWLDQYIKAYVLRDVARLFPGLNQDKFRVFARMLGGLSGQTVNQAEVARALGVSPPTVRDYFEIAQGSFLWRQLPPFIRNVTKRVVKHPKGYLRDSGLGHHAMRIPDVTALLSHPQAGAFWEGMVVEEICRQLEQRGIDFDAYHYRVSGGAEVDLVLEGNFGLVAVEIKLGQRVRLQSLRGLRDFVKEHDCRFGLVLSNEDEPRLIDHKVAGIPVRFL
jgi:predicted AAA+ superfamily ATPase